MDDRKENLKKKNFPAKIASEEPLFPPLVKVKNQNFKNNKSLEHLNVLLRIFTKGGKSASPLVILAEKKIFFKILFSIISQWSKPGHLGFLKISILIFFFLDSYYASKIRNFQK